MKNMGLKSFKRKAAALCLSFALVLGTLLTPVAAYAAATNPATELDGELSPIYQGSVGDCGAISAIQALDNSIYGKGLLKTMITVNSNKTYTLNFGSGKVTVTQKEVDAAHVTGDLDARVIEVALQKTMNVYNGVFACDVFTRMTGFKQKTSYGGSSKKSTINALAAKFASGQGAMAACDFTIADPSKGIIGDGGHSYSIRWVDEEIVVLINPWDTSKLIYMSRNQFENSIRYMTYVDESAKRVVVYWD
ncbi:hypothetical protein acsn021_10020 [Anaerocolumna cellulosilytica]|uniref:Uncharacterized protein n=1 Tax=Anaerocolumna cellulosilytica TaxID=433286 RepID=A0A6S6QQ18_9FIRM|nr:hypothetical protein [Anaerocolumna cellulosilytica]MBB5194488.1 hypothetical protein [Anaerocolumna cellulosilytica]BCJ93433.1 hypothetical protein acsn021_10020 [Anaerocolumna cellulosilytica]